MTMYFKSLFLHNLLKFKKRLLNTFKSANTDSLQAEHVPYCAKTDSVHLFTTRCMYTCYHLCTFVSTPVLQFLAQMT